MSRTASLKRTTKETDINCEINLDGTGKSDIHTGIEFFDHMLDQLSRHSGVDIALQATGDLGIDSHHTIEDCGWALGQALKQALGDKAGIERYGHAMVPMDETLSRVALDFSNRPFLVYHVHFTTDRLGPQMELELFREFFQSFSQSAGLTLHIENLYGFNNHHIIESIFKALARALKMAVTLDPRRVGILPSTKGQL
jgi:imidazoleglycerol-phosphate dehydratase